MLLSFEKYFAEYSADIKTSLKRFNFGLNDILDWSEMKATTTIFRMSPRRLKGDVLKTYVRRLKTSPRHFLVKARGHLESIYGLSIYVRFKLHTYYIYHSSIDKVIALIWINYTHRHGNTAEVVKTWFSMECQTRKYFFQELKYFLASDFPM